MKRISRNEEISIAYFELLDRHLADLISGKETEMLTLNQIAGILCITPEHLSASIKLRLGQHPCSFYDAKIIAIAKDLLTGTTLSVAEVARRLTYDPSNFSKFFKKYTGMPPGAFKDQHKKY
ncbi:helix-turn-helix domain-containing protein [Pedobacter nutrimenti]|uniref:AraC-like DNA-binding protein n=1 Tax=Pedobacter nutrimenti TaxID=1241337 RepID=A0A318UH79_9SPHI|nr:helix-turn-helix transcriptional regulator [Pedobacter nutrimenti]PYF74890.1 AraC-like DNA-binding protein [Pedobacter nutrimenti]